MSLDARARKPALVEEGFKEMKIKNGDSSDEEAQDTIEVEVVKHEPVLQNGKPNATGAKSAMQLPKRNAPGVQSPVRIGDGHREVVAGEITVKLEPGQPPKLARTPSKTIVARCAPTFDSYEDKTEEATGVFQLLTECTYSAKYLGSTEHAMECDCAEEWGKNNPVIYVSQHDSSYLAVLTVSCRCLCEDQPCLWGRLRLYQSCHQNGVFRRLRVRL